jgi:hypothetical protein
MIDIKSLDSFNFTNISLIKLDVEGYEVEVIKGAKNTIIKNNFPAFIVEIWRAADETKIKYYSELKNTIKSLLFEIGYNNMTLLQGDDYLFTR